MNLIGAYSTPYGSELVDSLINYENAKAATAAAEYQNSVVFSLQIPGGVLPGDILLIDGAIQATNPHTPGENVMFQGQLVLSQDPTDALGTPPKGYCIAHNMSFNISTNMHHGILQRSLSHTVANWGKFPTAYVNFSACAASNHFAQGEIALTIDKGYGSLTVAHFR